MHAHFSSSRLVRLIGGWRNEGAAAPSAPPAPATDGAEALSQWLGAFDAVRLHAVHQALRQQPAPARAVPGDAASCQALAVELQGLRQSLSEAMSAQDITAEAELRVDLVRAAQDPSPQTQAPFGPYRQLYADWQRQMDNRIAPLRARVRQAASRASPALRQLAALDAVLEPTLAAREQRLLAAVPQLLEQRFNQLRDAHLARLAAAGLPPDEAAAWRRPGGWLWRFGADWRQALQAELALRLEPVTGLMEAWSNEVDGTR